MPKISTQSSRRLFEITCQPRLILFKMIFSIKFEYICSRFCQNCFSKRLCFCFRSHRCQSYRRFPTMIANGFVLRVGTYLAIKNLGFTRAARRAICRGTVAWRKEERERIYPTSSGVAAADSLLGIEPPCCHTSFRNNGTVEEQEPVCLGKDVFQKNLVASHGVLFSPAPFPRRKPDVMKEWAKPKPQLLKRRAGDGWWAGDGAALRAEASW